MNMVILMNKCRFLLLLITLFSQTLLAAPFSLSKVESLYTDEELTALWDSFSDICSPNAGDYLKIENYLKYGQRPYFDILFSHLISHGYIKAEEIDRSLFFKQRLLQRTMFIGANQEMPVFEQRVLGGVSQDDKSRCIILYSTYNGAYNSEVMAWDNKFSYIDKLLFLVDELEEVGYKGHVLYHLGGYPLIEYGGLKLVHIPYSFKMMCFIEALLLGYDQVLWIDVAMHPTNDLSEVFEIIKNQGSLLIANGAALDYDYSHYIPILPDASVAAAGLTVQELSDIPHVTSGILGLSFENQKNHDLIAEWYRLTTLTYPAMTLYPEEFLLSVASWRTFNNPSPGIWSDYFDVRSQIPIKPFNSKKPFWFDKS